MIDGVVVKTNFIQDWMIMVTSPAACRSAATQVNAPRAIETAAATWAIVMISVGTFD